MMLLRSTLAFLVVLPAALAKAYRGRKTVKSSKAIQEVYFLKDDVTTLDLAIDFIAMLPILLWLQSKEEWETLDVDSESASAETADLQELAKISKGARTLMNDNIRGTQILSNGKVEIMGKNMFHSMKSQYSDFLFVDTMGESVWADQQKVLENTLEGAIGYKDAEDWILSTLRKAEKIYTSVEMAVGYVNTNDEYMLVAATLSDDAGELWLVGATGHNYGGNTADLNVMNYAQAMKSVDEKEWVKAVKIEHDKMVKYNVTEVVHPKDVPGTTELFTSTWAMKKWADGTEQHHSESSKGYFFDACTVIEGDKHLGVIAQPPVIIQSHGAVGSNLIGAPDYSFDIRTQVCNIDVCDGTYDNSGDANCFNLRFSGHRYVKIFPEWEKHSSKSTIAIPENPGKGYGSYNGGNPERIHWNSFTASLSGGTGRFNMAQGKAKFMVANPKHASHGMDRGGRILVIEYTIPGASEEAMHAHG